MKSSTFAIFFSIVLTIYALVNYYIFFRGLQSIPQSSGIKIIYISVFIFISLSYILARIILVKFPSTVADFFMWIGSFWLAAIAYFLLILLFFDFVRLLNHFIHFYPDFVSANYAAVKFKIAVGSLIIVVFLIISGHINARITNIKKLDLVIDKNTPELKTLNIVAASDIHLGTIIGKRRLRNLVDQINKLNPDIILLAGDVFDEDIAPVISRNLGDYLKQLKAPLGVYAILGNHEYIGGIDPAVKYLTDHNIIVLRDNVLKIKNSFFLAGRDDIQNKRFKGKARKNLGDLLVEVDKSLPVILLDHQPFKLNQAVENGVDLQISGHTHHGQIWPFNLITRKVFEVSRGYKKKENTHFYVSSGFGTWGPPVRIGNRPEIVNILLRFGS